MMPELDPEDPNYTRNVWEKFGLGLIPETPGTVIETFETLLEGLDQDTQKEALREVKDKGSQIIAGYAIDTDFQHHTTLVDQALSTLTAHKVTERVAAFTVSPVETLPDQALITIANWYRYVDPEVRRTSIVNNPTLCETYIRARTQRESASQVKLHELQNVIDQHPAGEYGYRELLVALALKLNASIIQNAPGISRRMTHLNERLTELSTENSLSGTSRHEGIARLMRDFCLLIDAATLSPDELTQLKFPPAPQRPTAPIRAA